MPDQPFIRLARAVVFATVCLALTTAGHAYAACTAVPGGTVALGFVLVAGLALVLAGTERSYRTILGALLGAQFGLHVLFVQATAGTAHHAGAPLVEEPARGGTAMTLAHLGAALVAAWWLRRGEAAAWSLARRVAAATGASWRGLFTARAPAALPVRPVVPASAPDRSAVRAPLRHVLISRGPPAPLSTTPS
ncbi:MFS transporter [Spirillospora sp. NPDC127200]